MQKKNNNNNKTMTCSHLWGFDLVSRTLYFPLICIVFFWATRSSLSHRKYFPFHHFKSSHVCWELDSYKILHEWCRARGRSAASQKSLEIFPCKQKKKKKEARILVRLQIMDAAEENQLWRWWKLPALFQHRTQVCQPNRTTGRAWQFCHWYTIHEVKQWDYST